MSAGRRRFEKSTPKIVSEEEIRQSQEEILSKNTTEFVPANIRNILFCGASRSGKTTVFSVLQNSCYCPQESSLFADTKETSFRTFSLRDRVDKTVHNFVVNLIDTPGTFEVRSTKDDFIARSNTQISDLIIDCINHEVTYLNLLVLVLNPNKLSDIEMDSIDLFLNLFGKTKIPIALCLTHADTIGDDRRIDIQREISTHPRLAQYFDDNIFSILWMGCVNHKVRDYTNKDTMREDYEEVANWRDEFMEKIFQAEKRIDLETTDIYASRKDESLKEMKNVVATLPKYLKIDFENVFSEDVHLALIKLNDTMDFLHNHTFYVTKERDPEYLETYQTFIKAVNDIKADTHLSEAAKKRLLSKWY